MFLSFCAVSTVKVFFVTKEAIRTLRLAPTFCRRMNTEGILCQVDPERFASLVSPALVTALNRSEHGLPAVVSIKFFLHQAQIVQFSNYA